MKRIKIKHLLKDLYTYGIYDGADIHRGKYDKFMGSIEARYQDRDLKLDNAYKELRKLIN